MKGFIFEELNEGAACRTYLLACPRTREALLVDPVLEHVPHYLERLERDGLRLVLVVDTYTRADHLSGGRELAHVTGCVHAGKPEGSVHRGLSEGDVLAVGDVRLLVREMPGPFADSLVLLMEGPVLLVFPTHDGAGRTFTPIEHERVASPRLRLAHEDTGWATIPHHAV